MAAKEAETKKAADTAEKVKEEKTKATEAKFLVEKLRENSMKLFGVTTSTFDGAFYGNTKQEMTIKEAGAIIHKWLGKE